MGPRGSGNTTWLRATFPDAHVFDLLSEDTYQRLLSIPRLFADELRAVPADKWVIVDEVQRLPGMLNEEHRSSLRPKDVWGYLTRPFSTRLSALCRLILPP